VAREGERGAVEALIQRGLSRPLQATDYDTSWALRLTGPDGRPAYPRLAGRLLDRQREDGSWGGQVPHAHDRLLTTLAVVISLHNLEGPGAERARAAGEIYLRERAGDFDPDSDRTIGFELIFPALLEEAAALGIDLPFGALDHLERERSAKLALLPRDDIFRVHTTALFSLEAFSSSLDVAGARGLLLENGSMANSPSATAFLMGRIPGWRDELPRSAAYLDGLLAGPDSGLPAAHPVDIFVRAWTLYYLQRGGLFEANREVLLLYLDHLLDNYSPEGVWFASTSGSADSDDTALSLLVLHRAGYEVDGSALLRFEEDRWFSTQRHESNPSTSTNLHVLEALPTVPKKDRGRVVEKILAYLFDARRGGAYWRDKWHASVYYPTTEALPLLFEHAPAEAEPTLRWLLQNQRPDGSWGEYGPTAEETSLVLLSLLQCHTAARPLPEEPLHRAAA
jgi:halimadienyl-diphosphate synthase